MRVTPALLVFLSSALLVAQNETPRWRPAVTLQTGLSSTFQLTLGGTFGEGPAWNDHLAVANVTYRFKWKLPLQISADDYVLLSSPLRRGNIVYIQASTSHTLWRAGSRRLVLKHGPATTHSYHFYDRPGWRVLRYTGTLAFETRAWTLEGSLRQQGAIAPHLPDNRYWCIQLSRRL
jgi:hypothetical protein